MTVDAYDGIRRDVLARIERRRLRSEGDLDEVRLEVHHAVDEYQRLARLGEELPLVSPAVMVDRVLRSITDFGPLTDLIARRDVEEIFVEGARVSYLDGSGRLRGLTVPTSEEENRQMIERLLAATDRQLNTKHPMVQARVLDGTARLTAAIPPIGDRLSATLRRYVVRNVTLDDLVLGTRCPGGRRVPRRTDAAPQPGRGLGRTGRGQDDARRRAARGGAARATACGPARRSASSRCRSPTVRTTRCARPRSTAPARSACAIWSSSCSRCDPTGSSSARCAAPRRSS